jgi:small GTP-binding protein
MPTLKRVKIKICLLGDPAVGKTSLIQKYIYNFFGDTYMRTLGTKVSRKVVKLLDRENDIEYSITMMIWDIMGQKFTSMPLDKYLKMSQGALVVCDITRKDTYQSLANWRKTLYEEVEEVPVIFLANKIDLKKDTALDISEFDNFCNSEGVQSYLTSAKTGQNVNDAFLKLGELIIKASNRLAPGKEPHKPVVDKLLKPIQASVNEPSISRPKIPIAPGDEQIPIAKPNIEEPLKSSIQQTDESSRMDIVLSDDIKIRPGLGYIIKEEKPKRSFKIFKELLKRNIHGLCITRTHPERIKDEYQIKDTPILWLSAESPNKENIVVPTFLPQLNTIIIDFIQKYNDVVILLEGIEYLIDLNDFKAVLRLAHSLNDYIMGSNARLLIPLDPLILQERELHMLTRDFKIL